MVEKTKYLIIGTSHAGLSAAEEIRIHDRKGFLTMVTMEDTLPYSPTILPYIVSGRVRPDQVILRDEDYFKKNKIHFIKGKAVTAVDPSSSATVLSDGDKIVYEKLLIATGSEPLIPKVENLENVPFLELRMMKDALDHLRVMKKTKSALVMGTGLVGIHTAENFVERGIHVDVVRARPKKNPRILPNYFDEDCSRLIQDVFESHGVDFYLKNYAVRAECEADKFVLDLVDGKKLEGDLFLVCTGIEARSGIVANTEIETDQGILVDRKMKTSVDNVWAAGDVAQAHDFFSQDRILNAILPDAVIQGKIAGAAMSGGKLDEDYVGGISMNTFNYFGNRAFSVGIHTPWNDKEYEINKTVLPKAGFYQKMVFQGSVLVGMSAVNSNLDPGIVLNLIKRKVDLKDETISLISNPLNASRRLMWKHWR
jgi:phenylglyoxylate dehydrogenase epsilon subunit